MNKKLYRLWYLVAFGFVILFLLMLVSSVLDVGDRLILISPYLAYAFYALILILSYILLIRPLGIIAFKNPKRIVLKDDQITSYQRMQKVIQSLPYIKDESKKALNNAKTIETLKPLIEDILEKQVKKEVTSIIKMHAKTVMISTAISQNGRLDFLTVVFVNIKMIAKIVEAVGFRPSYPELAKLTVQVMTIALVAEGLENLDLNDVLPQQTLNSLGEIPFIKPILSSTTQGISNALLTLRVGIVAREYLMSNSELPVAKIRKTAFLEAATLTPSVFADAISIFPKTVFNLFKTNKPQDSKEKK